MTKRRLDITLKKRNLEILRMKATAFQVSKSELIDILIEEKFSVASFFAKKKATGKAFYKWK